MEEQLYYLLYTTLKANTPIDTGNMYDNISLEDFGTLLENNSFSTLKIWQLC